MIYAILLSVAASAAVLEDVQILNATPSKGGLELKLQNKNGKKDSYFLLDIMKEDPKSFEKLSLVAQKLSQREKFQLNLDIPSFSASPSGSSYRSGDVQFSGKEKK